MPRLFGTRVVLNVDGIERKRKKWNALGRAWYLASEWLSTWCPSAIVTDAEVIETYYRDRYGATSTFIPYGCHVGRDAGVETLRRFGLEAQPYVLYVSRLEPENNALAVIQAYKKNPPRRQTGGCGDALYAENIRTLNAMAGPRVVFTGGVYGAGYRELQCHALAYVQATEVGGTHPALVEAMGFGRPLVVHDTPENRETAGRTALYADAARPETLARAIGALLARSRAPPALRARRPRRRAREQLPVGRRDGRLRKGPLRWREEARLGAALASISLTPRPGFSMLKQQARTIAALLYAADLSVTLATLPVAYLLRSEIVPLFARCGFSLARADGGLGTTEASAAEDSELRAYRKREDRVDAAVT